MTRLSNYLRVLQIQNAEKMTSARFVSNAYFEGSKRCRNFDRVATAASTERTSSLLSSPLKSDGKKVLKIKKTVQCTVSVLIVACH